MDPAASKFHEKAGFIWSVADLLRGNYKQSEYGKVILPLTVLRRLDQVLEPTKSKVLAANDRHKGSAGLDRILRNASGHGFYNTSLYTFQKLLQDPNALALNLKNHLAGYSPNARKILEEFRFEGQIERLDENKLLYLVVRKFSEIDLHPDRVSNREMGYIFEELIRRFSEISNETAGEHFTPRDVVRLMVSILLTPDDATLSKKGVIRKLYDPACGTGGMLSEAEEHVRELNPNAELFLYGQELNAESYAVCVSDMMIKGQEPDHIKLGNSFSEDLLPIERFDYMLCNPPFGVEWKNVHELIVGEHDREGQAGRFGAGLPRINDGALLFLQHMLSKMVPSKDGGTRLAIVFNGSPLFAGGAGSGESNIRRWIIENDWLDAIVALPENMFYNTGITTYLWFLTNRKPSDRKGKVQLIDASSYFTKMRRSLGAKRFEITDEQIAEVVKLYGEFLDGMYVRVLPIAQLGYRWVTVERPLRMSFQVTAERIERLKSHPSFWRIRTSKKARKGPAEAVARGEQLQRSILDALGLLPDGKIWKSRLEFEGALDAAFSKRRLQLPAAIRDGLLDAFGVRDGSATICTGPNGKPQADPELRDHEKVPLEEDVEAYFKREVVPFVPDAWINQDIRDNLDHQAGLVGYEINFNRYFFEYRPPRDVADIRADIKGVEREIADLIAKE
jgi:type I restriction enzyme M protein